MANNWGTQALVAKEIFFQFGQVGKIARNIDWRSEDFDAADNVGASKSYRRPTISAVTQTTPTAAGNVPSAPSYTDLVDPLVPLVISQKFVSNFQIGVDDLTLRVTREQALERHIKPTVRRMARMIDSYLGGIMLANAGQVIGTPGSNATGATLMSNFAQAQGLLNWRGREDDGDSVVITSETAANNLVTAQLTQFNPNEQISKLYRQGLMGEYAGFQFYRSPLLPADNVSAAPSVAGVVSGAGQGSTTWAANTTTIAVTGITPSSGTYKAGTKIRLTGVNWVNPDTKVDTGILATFVLAADATITAGAATLVLAEPMIISGPHQNVTGAPANNAPVINLSVTSGAIPSLAFSRKAVIAASPKLALPRNLDFKEQENVNGINISLIESHDPYTFTRIFSIQALVGACTHLPEHIVSVY